MAHARRVVFIVLLSLATFLGPFGGNMILPMFKVLKSDFNVNILYLGASITVYMLPFSIVQFFSGVLSDVLFGRRVLIVSGFLAYSLGSLMASTSPNIWLFLVGRACQGVGNALVAPIVLALVGDLFETNIRGRIMGVAAIATTLGTSFGPIFGGYIAEVNWRLAFILTSVISVSLAVAFSLILPPLRGGGAKSLSNVLETLKYNLTNLKVLLIGFVGFSLFFSRISIFTYLSEILSSKPYSLSEGEIGNLLSLAGFGGLASGLASGYLTDKLGRRETVILGLSLLAPIFGLYASASWHAILPLILFSQGFLATTAFTSLNTIAVEVNPRSRATVTSIYGSMRFLGYALGPLLVFPVYSAFSLGGVATVALTLMILASTLVFYTFKI